MNALRPIGTEFEIDLGVNSFSTDPRGQRIKFRIVDHVKAFNLMGKEEIKEISREYYDVDYSRYNWLFTF